MHIHIIDHPKKKQILLGAAGALAIVNLFQSFLVSEKSAQFSLNDNRSTVAACDQYALLHGSCVRREKAM